MRKKVGKNICNKMEMIKKERLIIKMGKKYLIKNLICFTGKTPNGNGQDSNGKETKKFPLHQKKKDLGRCLKPNAGTIKKVPSLDYNKVSGLLEWEIFGIEDIKN